MSRGIEMRVHNESVFHLIEKYLHGDVMIPAFQRPYVWTRKNVEDLVDSLVNRYPVGALTFIGAHNMPAMAMQEQHVTMAAQRNYFSHVFERGMQLDFNIVLDGAQRIQTLYKLFVNGDYRLLFNPFDDSWKVVTPEEQAEMGDIWPYTSVTSMYCRHYMHTIRKDLSSYPESEKLMELKEEEPIAPAKSQMRLPESCRHKESVFWSSRYEERLLRLEQGRRQGLPDGVEGDDTLVDLYIEALDGEKLITKVPPTLTGKDVSEDEKRIRRNEIARLSKKRDKELEAHNAKYKEIYALVEAMKPQVNMYWDRIENFEQKVTQMQLPVNRFSVGQKGQLRQAIQIFKRINSAGVPVDIEFLEALSEES